jgi:hypothetical protein
VCTTVRAADGAIPSFLVGVWATKDSKFYGQALMSGAAFYLWSDGQGATVGGPPPIGVALKAQFSSSDHHIYFSFVENGQVSREFSVAYDPATLTITSAGDQPQTMYRRFVEIDPAIRKTLGL